MLSATWTNLTDSERLAKVMRALDAMRRQLAHAKPSKNIIIAFGITNNSYTHVDGEKFLLQYSAIFQHVQMLAHVTHSELPPRNRGNNNNTSIEKRSCLSGFSKQTFPDRQ